MHHEPFTSGMLCAHAEDSLAHYTLGVARDLHMKVHERKSNSINFNEQKILESGMLNCKGEAQRGWHPIEIQRYHYYCLIAGV